MRPVCLQIRVSGRRLSLTIRMEHGRQIFCAWMRGLSVWSNGSAITGFQSVCLDRTWRMAMPSIRSGRLHMAVRQSCPQRMVSCSSWSSACLQVVRQRKSRRTRTRTKSAMRWSSQVCRAFLISWCVQVRRCRTISVCGHGGILQLLVRVRCHRRNADMHSVLFLLCWTCSGRAIISRR